MKPRDDTDHEATKKIDSPKLKGYSPRLMPIPEKPKRIDSVEDVIKAIKYLDHEQKSPKS